MNNEIEQDLSAFDLPHKCDRCGNGQPVPGLCPLCRLSDVEKKLKALVSTIEEYMPVAIPRGKHKLTKTFVNGVGGVPVWVSVVVAQPVLVVPPDKFHDIIEFQDSEFNLPVQLIKDEYQAVGGAARSVGPPRGPVDEFIKECEGESPTLEFDTTFGYCSVCGTYCGERYVKSTPAPVSLRCKEHSELSERDIV